MACRHVALVCAAIVVAVSAGCSPSPDSSRGTTSLTAQPAQLSTGKDQTLKLTPGQLLAATHGATPVAFTQPANGVVAYGPRGIVVYTPNRGFTGTDQLQVTTTDAVKLFAVDTPPLTIVGDVPIQSSGAGSAIALVPGSADEVYGLTDRGPNVDGRTGNEKVLPVADYQPRIEKFRLRDGTASVERTILLIGPDGAPINGLSDPGAPTGETLITLDGSPLPTSDHGLDTEGLVALADGTFWVSDEYGPSIVHFDANGKELQRLSPYNGALPRELSLRTPNQGLEGLTITPDGSTLVGIMQSALTTPGLQGSAKAVPLTRILTVNLATKAVHEYLYPLGDPDKTKVVVSEITALSATSFLVVERDGELQPGANKKIYLADISGATDVGPSSTVANTSYRAEGGGLLVDGKPIETLIGVTSEAKAVQQLKSNGINVAGKTPKLDIGALLTQLNPRGDFFGHDKLEGLATPDGGKTIVISNDSDFGLAGIESTGPPFTLEPKVLPNGTQDSGEFLFVDTSRLPARTQTVTLSIKVG